MLFRLGLVSGTPSGVTSCRGLSAATKGGQNPDVASLIRPTLTDVRTAG